jgi:amidase
MPTTAGARVLHGNRTDDAFVTRRLQANGAILLGKTNLSEWAYYFCDGCPLGYSAMGGQTLNPYGRKLIETGGSSSGSAVAVAANYAPVAVGSETSGSILSPASLNSTVGLKPTTGLLSRSGVVPISSSLDTLGPIARSVTDAVILFNAMTGYDHDDLAMPLLSVDAGLSVEAAPVAGKRLGFVAGLEEEPLFAQALERLRTRGAELVPVTLAEIEVPAFGEFLGAEMRFDLSSYLTGVAGAAVDLTGVADIIGFNNVDPGKRAPYGQGRFEAMAAMSHDRQQVAAMLDAIRASGQAVLGGAMAALELDALLSLNNRHASLAAAANYPAMTIPIGMRDNGEPVGLTLIAPSFGEQILVDLGLVYEQLQQGRVVPGDYQ